MPVKKPLYTVAGCHNCVSQLTADVVSIALRGCNVTIACMN